VVAAKLALAGADAAAATVQLPELRRQQQ